MKAVKQNFKDMMFMELRDLRQDLELLIEQGRQRLGKQEISDRVFQENTALFKNEILGLKDFEQILENANPQQFPSLDELINHLSRAFRNQIKSANLAEAIVVCVERKMKKVADYIKL